MNLKRSLQKASIAMAFAMGAILLASEQKAHAQTTDTCDNILSGLVDFKTTTSEEEFAETMLQWFKSTKAESQSSAKAQARNVGFSIPDYFEDFTYDDNKSESSNRNWSEALHNHFSRDAKTKKKFYELIKQANPTVVNGWLECKKLNNAQGRLRCWAEPQFNDPKYAIITYDYRPIYKQPTRPTIREIVKTPNLTDLGGTRIGSAVVSSAAPDNLIYTRSNKESAYVQIRLNSPGLQCLARVPPLPLDIVEPPRPKKPCVELSTTGECTRCKIEYAQGTRIPYLLKDVTPPSLYCENMKDGKYRVTFSGTMRANGPLKVAYPRVLINAENQRKNSNFAELGARLDPNDSRIPPQSLEIGDSTEDAKHDIRPINKRIAVMLHMNGETHCQSVSGVNAGCFLDTGSVLIAPDY